MAAPYILAHTFGDAHAFARDELDIPRGYYRVVTSPSSIKGPHGAKLYLVPGWRKRFDRFAMQSAIRWTRLTVIDVAEQAEAPAPEPILDGLMPPGEQTSLVDATDFVVAPESEDETPVEEPEKRRRRRCKECGVLVDPDEVDQHAAEHLPEGV